MRKIAWLLAMVLALGCTPPALGEDTPAEVLGDSLRIVMYEVVLNPMTAMRTFAETSLDGSLREGSIGEVITVQSLAEAQMMLDSGRADTFITLHDTVAYLASRDGRYRALQGPMRLDLHMIAAPGQAELIATLDAALAKMEGEGTIQALFDEHVQATLDGAEPVAVSLPTIEGVPVVRIGVSGDNPPIDYTTPDGQPAGFNTAMLAALAAEAGVNIELLVIESGARFAALQSGRIDAFFWHMRFGAGQYQGVVRDGAAADQLMAESDQYLLSRPYWSTHIGWLLVR